MRTSRRWWLVFFLGPATVLFAAFITYPILSALAFSLYAGEGMGRRAFVGLASFPRLFGTCPYAELLVNAFWHNVLVYIATMLLQNVTALGLAVLLARGPWGARGYRVIFFLPVMLSLVIVGFLWALFLNPVFGLVNKVLTLLHAGALARPWLGDASTALLTLIVVNAVLLRRREVELAGRAEEPAAPQSNASCCSTRSSCWRPWPSWGCPRSRAPARSFSTHSRCPRRGGGRISRVCGWRPGSRCTSATASSSPSPPSSSS